MALTLVVLTHAERCTCGLALPAGVRAGWDDVADEIICSHCLELADQLEDVEPPDVSLTRAS